MMNNSRWRYRFATYYEAKFAREAMNDPTAWMISAVGTPQRPSYELRYLPPSRLKTVPTQKENQ